MRNLLTSAIASLSLATLLVGSASAAGMRPSSNVQLVSANAAAEDTLERDAAQSWLRRSPEGVVVSRGDRTLAPSRLDQNAYSQGATSWLDRSPAGQVIGQSGGNQAAGLTSSRDE
jgi:hypothetical protein